MDAHVAKPIAVGQLLAAIGAALAGTHASSPAAAPQADDALDRGRLGQLRRLYPSDRDFRAFADSFTDDARAGMDRLATAARAGDAGAVRRSAHALRGPCSLTGAHRVEALLADIERRCGQGDVPDTAAIEVLERSYRDAGKALAAQLG
jgi:HPt (histidine-containing phosphotransfer) domain-containing protein